MPTLNPAQGILGGTFDPIHLGHLGVARDVCQALGLAFVRLLPAGAPPHRAPPFFSAAQRLQFCELAAQGQKHLRVDAREVHKLTPSYTIETLEQLRAENPNTPQVLILGADAFMGLHRWNRWAEILMNCHIAVVTRPGFDMATQLPEELKALWNAREATLDPNKQAGDIFAVTVSPIDVSATRIRALLAQRENIAHLVDPNVARAISALPT
jgi:nicotinate-nucleotide adenylyltransferase